MAKTIADNSLIQTINLLERDDIKKNLILNRKKVIGFKDLQRLKEQQRSLKRKSNLLFQNSPFAKSFKLSQERNSSLEKSPKTQSGRSKTAIGSHRKHFSVRLNDAE